MKYNHIIEFDGGSTCNVPKLGYGDGYGSYQIDQREIVRLQFGKGFSANAAEILTLAASPSRAAAISDPSKLNVSLLSFLGASAESYRYKMDWDKLTPDSNASLFPRPVVEWAYQNSDEISILLCEIEESETPLIEE